MNDRSLDMFRDIGFENTVIPGGEFVLGWRQVIRNGLIQSCIIYGSARIVGAFFFRYDRYSFGTGKKGQLPYALSSYIRPSPWRLHATIFPFRIADFQKFILKVFLVHSDTVVFEKKTSVFFVDVKPNVFSIGIP